jgi:D-lyxose ketol-isomerase
MVYGPWSIVHGPFSFGGCLRKPDYKISGYHLHGNKDFDAGFTLVETTVAIAILLGVLVPAILFFGRATMRQTGLDLIVATNLAQEEMEKTIAFRIYKSGESIIKFNHKTWRIVRAIEHKTGLIEIRIGVFRLRKTDPVVELKTMRTSDNE